MLNGIDPLPTSFEAVRANMKGIRRTKGAAQIRKAPATHGIIADMIASCPETLRGTRARALLLLDFPGAFRRSELAALTVADLEANEAGLRVRVRRSKTDQEGKGQIVAILAGTRLSRLMLFPDGGKPPRYLRDRFSARSIATATSCLSY